MKLGRMALFIGLALAYPLSAMASPVVIQDGFVRAGLSDHGTLGSDEGTSPGLLYDPTGTGTYGVNDFLTPGTPFEGFYITGSSVTGAPISEFSNNTTGYHGGSTFPSVSPTSVTGTSGTWTATSNDGLLKVENDYSLATVAGVSKISITTTITNLGGSGISNLQFLRTEDPDPDVNAFGSFFTNNVRVNANEACGTGPQSGETLCIDSTSPFTHNAGVNGTTGPDAPWSRRPIDYLNGSNDGDGDYAIGIGFLLGDLGAGQSVTFNYDYQFGKTLDVIIGSTPEPATLALFGTGILGLAARYRRRRQNAAK